MKETIQTQPEYPVWIDKNDRIISFKYAEGFERLDFPSRDEMLAFALEKGTSGYRVQ